MAPATYPRLRDDLTLEADAGGGLVVKDGARSRYYEFNSFQAEVLERLDGKSSVAEIADTLGDLFDAYVPKREIQLFVAELGKRYLLDLGTSDDLTDAQRKRASKQALRTWRDERLLDGLPDLDSDEVDEQSGFLQLAARWLEKSSPAKAKSYLDAASEINPDNERAKRAALLLAEATVKQLPKPKSPWPAFELFDPKRLLGALDRIFGFIFTRWFFRLFVVLIVVAVVINVLQFDRFAQLGALKSWTGTRLSIAIGTIVVLTFVHELGHGVALTHYGGRPTGIGVMLMLYFAPAAFCDTSDAYLLKDRKAKVIVYAAGVGVTTIIWCIVSPLFLLSRANTFVGELLLILALFAGVINLVQFIPLIQLDGYWILVSLTGNRQLAAEADNHLREVQIGRWRKKLRHTFIGRLVFVGVANIALAPLLIFTLMGYAWELATVLLIVCLLASVRLFQLAARGRPDVAAVKSLFGPASLLYRVTWMSWLVAVWWSRVVPTLKAFGVLIVATMLYRMLKMVRSVLVGPKQTAVTSVYRVKGSAWAIVALLWLAIDIGAMLLVPWRQSVVGDVTIEARSATVVRPPVAGQLVSLAVREGQRVKVGQILGRLDNADLDLELAGVVSETRRCAAQLALAKRGATPEQRRVEARRAAVAALAGKQSTALRKWVQGLSSVLPREQLRRLRAAEARARAGAAAASAKRAANTATDKRSIAIRAAACRALTSRAAKLRQRRERLVLRSSAVGVVVSPHLHDRIGAWIARGAPLMRIVDPAKLRAVASIDRAQALAALRQGLDAKVFLQTGTAKPLRARIEWIAPRLSKDAKLVVKLAIASPPSWLRASMRGRVRIVGAKRSMLAIATRPALVFFSVEFWRLF